jgi:4a-hydroxytetrahydrobiopterin dehydratase
MATLTSEQVKARLAAVPGWELGDKAITRTFKFADFAEAIAYVVRLGFAAEAVDHHPDITVNYSKVTLIYATHSEGGLTEKDFAGAAVATKLAGAAGR